MILSDEQINDLSKFIRTADKVLLNIAKDIINDDITEENQESHTAKMQDLGFGGFEIKEKGEL